MKSCTSLNLLSMAIFAACALAVSCGKKDENLPASAAPDSKGTNTNSAATVRRAAALYKDGATKVFVELRAPNYPGSTYTLTYDQQSDQLYGQYYRAAM